MIVLLYDQIYVIELRLNIAASDGVTHLRPDPRGRGSGLASKEKCLPLRLQTHAVGRDSCLQVNPDQGGDDLAAGGGDRHWKTQEEPTVHDSGLWPSSLSG